MKKILKILIPLIIFLVLVYSAWAWKSYFSHPPISHLNLPPRELSYLEQKIIDQHSKNKIPSQPGTRSIKVPILVYHSIRPYYFSQTAFQKEYDVPPEIFEKQLKYLEDNGYQNISLNDLAEYLLGSQPILKKAYVLTFDDGWKNQYLYALPILKKHHLTATFFIYTKPIGSYPAFMTWSDLKALAEAGMTIGDHTETHPLLPSLKSEKILRKEIIESKKIIEDHIGKKVDFFAYPFYHYSDQIVSLVKEAGFKAARSGYESKDNDLERLFILRSLQITGNMDNFIKKIKS